MISLHVFDDAERELEHAALTYQRERSGWGDKFMDEYEAIVDRALRLPHSGALGLDVDKRKSVNFSSIAFDTQSSPYFVQTISTLLR